MLCGAMFMTRMPRFPHASTRVKPPLPGNPIIRSGRPSRNMRSLRMNAACPPSFFQSAGNLAASMPRARPLSGDTIGTTRVAFDHRREPMSGEKPIELGVNESRIVEVPAIADKELSKVSSCFRGQFAGAATKAGRRRCDPGKAPDCAHTGHAISPRTMAMVAP